MPQRLRAPARTYLTRPKTRVLKPSHRRHSRRVAQRSSYGTIYTMAVAPVGARGRSTSVQQMAVRQPPGDPVLQLLQVPSGDQLDLPRSPCSARRRTSSKCSRWIEITRSTRPFVEASPYAATNSSSRLSRSGGLLKRCQRIAGGVVAERAPRTRTRTRRHQAGRRAGRTRSQADPPVWSRLTRSSTGPSRRGKPTDLGRRCRPSRRITPDLSRGRQPATG